MTSKCEQQDVVSFWMSLPFTETLDDKDSDFHLPSNLHQDIIECMLFHNFIW